MNSAEPLLQVKGLCKHFGSGERRVDVLRGINLSLSGQESIAVVGASVGEVNTAPYSGNFGKT